MLELFFVTDVHSAKISSREQLESVMVCGICFKTVPVALFSSIFPGPKLPLMPCALVNDSIPHLISLGWCEAEARSGVGDQKLYPV